MKTKMTLPEKGLEKNPDILGVNNCKDCTVSTINGYQHEDKVYTYDEAIDLAGNGGYVFGLLAVLTLALAGMAMDMFGFSVVVTSACDFELTQTQKSILLSMPFLGSIIMAYPWGYITDTQGRLKGLLISLWGSFILASISAFSPNWIALAVLRFGSTSLSSGIQSLSFTLLGESCSSKLKSPALIGVTTSLFFTFGIYSVCAYFILSIHFSIDLYFIVFKPWRLLALVLALPLGVSALLSSFFYESPKFLLNAGHEKEAIDFLRKISKRNGVKVNKYPVKRVILNETTSLKRNDLSLLHSLMDQTFPLFKPPLLYRTIQLFYIAGVFYSSNNGFYSWLPVVADTFNLGLDDNITDGADNMCGLISTYKVQDDTSTCIETVTEFTVWIGLIQGLVYCFLNFILSLLSRWKKLVLIILIIFSCVCGVLIPLLPGRILSISLFYGFLMNSLCMPIIFSYYVDLFPTSYRGMAACLGVMVARISSLVGMNLVGSYLVSHCVASWYGWSVFLFSCAIVSSFLPPDKPKKKV